MPINQETKQKIEDRCAEVARNHAQNVTDVEDLLQISNEAGNRMLRILERQSADLADVAQMITIMVTH